ncbi:hypothetical protein V8F20_010360 [Naviculisporaceae sp. PSN 640]
MDSPSSIATNGRTGRTLQVIHRLSLRYLIIPPVILAILTGFVLFAHSDTNLAMLYSQCHARARLPFISKHIPLLGSPICFLVSFFQEALASAHKTVPLMSGILSFVGGLLTVSMVESSRICNQPNILIAYPTGPWLVFNLAGGALVWQLVIIPAFFKRSREIILARRSGITGGADLSGPTDPNFGQAMRHLDKVAEIVAIPLAVGIGYILPSALMVFLPDSKNDLTKPVSILVWLLFPLWVSLIRQAVHMIIIAIPARFLPAAFTTTDEHDGTTAARPFHLESNPLALGMMYTLPILASVLSHGYFLYSLSQGDDRKEMTRAAIRFIVINVLFIGLTTLYWIFVEAGWRVTAVMIGASLVLGPGAGICIGWIYRESTVDPDRSVTVVAVGARRGSGQRDGSGSPASEETPLLRA